MVEEFGLRAKIEPEVDDESVQRESGRLERQMEDIDPEVTPSVSGLTDKIKKAAGGALGGLGTAAGVGASVASAVPGSQDFLPDAPTLDTGSLIDIGGGGGTNEEKIAELIELTREQNQILAEQTEALDDDFLSGGENGSQEVADDAAGGAAGSLLGRAGAKLAGLGGAAAGLASVPALSLGGTAAFGGFGLFDRATNGGSEGFQFRNFARGAEVDNTILEQGDNPNEGIDPGQSLGSFASERFDKTLFEPLEDAADKISNADLGESLDVLVDDVKEQFGSISLGVDEERLPSLPVPEASELPKLPVPDASDLPSLSLPESLKTSLSEGIGVTGLPDGGLPDSISFNNVPDSLPSSISFDDVPDGLPKSISFDSVPSEISTFLDSFGGGDSETGSSGRQSDSEGLLGDFPQLEFDESSLEKLTFSESSLPSYLDGGLQFNISDLPEWIVGGLSLNKGSIPDYLEGGIDLNADEALEALDKVSFLPDIPDQLYEDDDRQGSGDSERQEESNTSAQDGQLLYGARQQREENEDSETESRESPQEDTANPPPATQSAPDEQDSQATVEASVQVDNTFEISPQELAREIEEKSRQAGEKAAQEALRELERGRTGLSTGRQ